MDRVNLIAVIALTLAVSSEGINENAGTAKQKEEKLMNLKQRLQDDSTKAKILRRYYNDTLDDTYRSVDLSQGKAGATSVLRNDEHFAAANAFKRAHYKGGADHQRTYPWISDDTRFSEEPQIVYIQLPRAVAVSAFSFRSRPEPIPPYPVNWNKQYLPRKFDLVGSDDCDSDDWTTIWRVPWTEPWTKPDQLHVWKVYRPQIPAFSCIGFRVLANGWGSRVAIQDAKFWEGGPGTFLRCIHFNYKSCNISVVAEKNDRA